MSVSPTAEIAIKIIDTLALAEKPFRKICIDNDVLPGSMIRFILRDEDLEKQYVRAKEIQMESLGDEIIDISDESPLCTTEGEGWSKTQIDSGGVQRNKLRVDTRKWVMSKLAPKKYGDKTPGGADNPLHAVVEFTAKSILEDK